MNLFLSFLRPALFTAVALLTILPAAHAQEANATVPNPSNERQTMTDVVNARFDRFNFDLATAIAERKAADLLMKKDLDTAVVAMTQRLDLAQAEINRLDARFEEIKKLVQDDIDKTRKLLNQLNTDLIGNVNLLQERIDSTYGYINSTISNLDTRLGRQQARVEDLYADAAYANRRIASLTKMVSEINRILDELARCVQSGKCVERKAPKLTRANFQVSTTNDTIQELRSYIDCGFLGSGCWFGGSGTVVYHYVTIYGVKDTGLTYPEWPYCAITGAQNQDVRDFNIMLEGNRWLLVNEPIGGREGRGENSFNQENGSFFASCIKFE